MKRSIDSLKTFNSTHQYQSVKQQNEDMFDSFAHKDDGIRQCNSIADLALVDPTQYLGALVKGVGFFSYTSNTQTPNGYSIVASQTVNGGYWVLSNASITAPKRLKEAIELARVYPGMVTNALTPVTKSGAMSTATISAVGGFDQFVVTGGVNNTSFIAFDRISACDNFGTIKARVKCVAVGATDPIVGIGFRANKLTNDTSSAYYHQAVFHLKTKVAEHIQGAAGVSAATVSKSSVEATLVNANDIVEITAEYDPANNRMIASLVNINTGGFIEAYWTITARSASFDNRPLTLTLGDGTYILLDMKVMSSVPKEPLIGIVGDSYACGDNIAVNQNWPFLVQQALPQYDVLCLAGNGSYVNSMSQYQIQDIMRLRPKYVFFLHILHLFYGYFNAGGANQAEFDTAYNRLLDMITGYGGIPVLVKWQSGNNGFLTNNGPAWATKIATIQSSYPTALVLDLSNLSLQLNNSSHPTVADALQISQAVVSFLQSAGAV